jgi:hypothetical protein
VAAPRWSPWAAPGVEATRNTLARRA